MFCLIGLCFSTHNDIFLLIGNIILILKNAKKIQTGFFSFSTCRYQFYLTLSSFEDENIYLESLGFLTKRTFCLGVIAETEVAEWSDRH